MVAPPLLAGAEKDTTAEATPAVAKAAVGGSGAEVSAVIMTEPAGANVPLVAEPWVLYVARFVIETPLNVALLSYNPSDVWTFVADVIIKDPPPPPP
jgi:hypothetical protein